MMAATTDGNTGYDILSFDGIYSLEGPGGPPNTFTREQTVRRSDPGGGVQTTTSRIYSGKPTEIVIGNAHWRFQYDNFSRLVYSILPEATFNSDGSLKGGYSKNEYDGNGNITSVIEVPKEGPASSGIMTSATFGTLCSNGVNWNKPCSATDANGHTTAYTYSSVHGGVLSELKPAVVLSGPGSPGSARPLKLTTWEQRHAWVKKSTGGWLQLEPIWMVKTVTDCQSVVPVNDPPVCDPSAPRTDTIYEYGDDQQPASGARSGSLLIKGIAVSSGGSTLRTCYGYDVYDRRVSERKPNADLSQCPSDFGVSQ